MKYDAIVSSAGDGWNTASIFLDEGQWIIEVWQGDHRIYRSGIDSTESAWRRFLHLVRQMIYSWSQEAQVKEPLCD